MIVKIVKNDSKKLIKKFSIKIIYWLLNNT